ncbi:hypothetical protein ACS0TY_003673 [Phlomoides rotata]
MWDMVGDAFDSMDDVDILGIVNLSLDEPKLESVLFGDEGERPNNDDDHRFGLMLINFSTAISAIYLWRRDRGRPSNRATSAVGTQLHFLHSSFVRFYCGMFTVKYIEFLLAGKDVSLIRPDYMREWRKKLAANILSQSFDL